MGTAEREEEMASEEELEISDDECNWDIESLIRKCRICVVRPPGADFIREGYAVEVKPESFPKAHCRLIGNGEKISNAPNNVFN